MCDRRTTAAGIFVMLAGVLVANAADFPLAKIITAKAGGDGTLVIKSLPKYEAVRTHADNTVGGPTVYQQDQTSDWKDLQGNKKAQLGYLSPKANDSQTFSTTLDLSAISDHVRFAVLADDTATVTIADKTGATQQSFSSNGGALWQPASFQVSPFFLPGKNKYKVTVEYTNTVHWKRGDAEDVDGCTFYVFKAGKGIFDKWNVKEGRRSIKFKLPKSANDNNVKGFFVDSSGFPTVGMAADSQLTPDFSGADLSEALSAANSETYAKNCLRAGLAATTLEPALRYIPTQDEEIHHIIPWDSDEVADVRDRAEAAGIKIKTDPVNLVCLPHLWHQQHCDSAFYFKRINTAFARVTLQGTFKTKLNDLAHQLLIESGKLLP